MVSLESIGEVFCTDVLIVGGGPAGLIAANRIKERNNGIDVLVVDEEGDRVFLVLLLLDANANAAGDLSLAQHLDDLCEFGIFGAKLANTFNWVSKVRA